MLHTGIVFHFSGIGLFKKFQTALLVATLVFGGTPLAAGQGASQAPNIALNVTNPMDVLDAGLCAVILAPALPGPDMMTSLREAICVANNTPLAPPGVPHMINFMIPVGFPIMIGAVPGTPGPLPPIITPMIIFGPGIVIDGSAAGPGNGLTINNTNGVQVTGLVIQNFVGNGIEINGGSQHFIQNNHIGIDIGGLVPQPNGGDGIQITNSGGNQIGGAAISNVISCNGNNGIEILGLPSVGNRILGNVIGTHSNGNGPCPNQMAGINISNAPGNIIGGVNPGEGNVISANVWGGIFIDGVTAASNIIHGNLIGTDINGTRDLGNTGGGIAINKAPSNTVGGPVSKARNVISGNNGYGIAITSNSATGNQVYNNLIGTNITGTFAISNTGSGIYIDAPMNLIGAASMGNLISGNGGDGVFIDFTEASGNQVLGNKIGTNLTGTAAIPNQLSGIQITDAPTNTIGGPGAQDGNIISGNLYAGVYIEGSLGLYGAYNNKLLGNRIGTDGSGTSDLGNTYWGVYLDRAAGSTIGGSVAGAGNLISGNGREGVYISGAKAHHNRVLGNLIGTNIGGTGSIPNDGAGIFVSGAPTNTIGGPGALEGNLVSGNQGSGMTLFSGAYNNQLLGNIIGADNSGTSALANNSSGVIIQDSFHNTIGGSAAGEGNLISGNHDNGIEIITDVSGNAHGNRVLGNKIGTDFAGSAAIPNQESGIYIYDVPTNTIGGSGALEGNLISGNLLNGVDIYGSTVLNGGYGNTLSGNKIGTNSSGNSALGNGYSGVFLKDALHNTIGGSAAGAGNLISGNGRNGIEMVLVSNGDMHGNRVLGNKIGTNLNGSAAVPNQWSGISISDVPTNTIGGAGSLEGNLISGNLKHGIYFYGSVLTDGPHNNTLQGNKIGTSNSGNSALGNGYSGVYLENAARNTIGGSAAGAGNLISGNGKDGITLYGTNARNNRVSGNKIGTNLNGSAALENGFSGISISSAPTNTIGGITTGSGNLISGNDEHGVLITGTNSIWNVLYGNLIGLDATGVLTIPNESSGIFVSDALSTTIGGVAAGQANTITGNLQDGVSVVGSGALYNRISGNSIYKNRSLGIDLGNNGVTANDNQDPDNGPNKLQNYPLILLATIPDTSLYLLPHTTIAGELNSTVSTQFKIEFYSSPTCDPSGYGEGKVFLGVKSVTTDASGKVNFTFDTNYATAVGEFLTAIAIDPWGNSSEFSACRRIDAAVLYLPVIRK